MMERENNEPAGSETDIRQARIKKFLNGNLADDSMGIRISYQAVPAFGPKGGQRLHKAGYR